jgi:hypothetical protein
LLSDVTNEQKYMNASFREWIVIMNLGTLVGVHGDRAASVVWIWRGFARLERRSSRRVKLSMTIAVWWCFASPIDA